MAKIALGLGSNISPRKKYILQAIAQLQALFAPLIISSLYKTSPYEQKKQKDYYNLIVFFSNEKEPLEILKATQGIEQNLGRAFLREKKRPRNIDIDILFYDNQSIQTENLTIPHYDLWNRDFFLIPLLELVDKTFPSRFQKQKLHQALLAVSPSQKTKPTLVAF